MASASVLNDDDEKLQPKPSSSLSKLEDNKSVNLEELKKNAFIAPTLPADFLRIALDQRQIAESKDQQLATQLQYNYNSANMYLQPNGLAYRELIDYGRGKLQIDIVEAKLNKNYGFTRMDPYVRLKLGPRMFETPTAYNGSKNPVWKKSILCYLPRNVDALVIEIYDEKSFTDDELIAFVKFPFPKSLFEGIFIDEWIPLTGKLGEQKEGYINIQMLFTPLENMESQTNSLPNNNRVVQPVMMKSSLNSTPSSSASSNISDSSSENTTTAASALGAQPVSVNLPPEDTASAGHVMNSSSSTLPNVNNSNVQAYTDEDLNSIKEMFPAFDIQVIKSILDLNRGNKEISIEALLQMN